MIDYIIEYRTLTEYEKPVKQGAYEFLIMPCENETQKVKHFRLLHSMGREPFTAQNKYGFLTHHFHSYTAETFEYFSLSLLAQVAKNSPPIDLFSSLSSMEESAILGDIEFQMDQQSFLQFTDLSRLKLDDFPLDLLRQKDETLGNYVLRINAALHQMFQYLPGVTTTATPAKAVLKGGKGVCQDFAHVMIGMLRLQGIPCRYVSGYLNLSDDRADSQLHAWVEVFIPDIGWRGFDPTNNLQENDHFIKIAHGRDYLDCQPIKGVLHTDGDHKTSYEVSVRNSQNYDWFLKEQQQQQQQ